MKLYTIVVNTGDAIAQWAGTQADAKAAKREQQDKHPGAAVEWREFEVPTDKAGLLQFLNTHCTVKLLETQSGE